MGKQKIIEAAKRNGLSVEWIDSLEPVTHREDE